MDRLCGWMCPTVSRSINYDFSFQICRGPVRDRKRHTGEFCEGRYTLLQAAYVEEQYPDCDVELQDGGQPLYYYIIAVE